MLAPYTGKVYTCKQCEKPWPRGEPGWHRSHAGFWYCTICQQMWWNPEPPMPIGSGQRRVGWGHYKNLTYNDVIKMDTGWCWRVVTAVIEQHYVEPAAVPLAVFVLHRARKGLEDLLSEPLPLTFDLTD